MSRTHSRLVVLAAAAAVALTGGAPVAAAAPEHAAPEHVAGCGTPPQSGPRTVVSGDRERTALVHLPDGYDAGRAWPVLLAFHGRGNTGAGTAEFSGLSRLPAVVVYPEGVVGTGDGDRQAWQGAPYAAPGVDDVTFTHDLIDDLEHTLCVDPRRVYATGKSNGAGFTALLACRAADRIAAIAPVAGAFYPDTSAGCAPTRPVPVIAFHGTADATIPYGGDVERGLPAIADWAAGWAGRDGCASAPTLSVTPPDVTRTDWADCADGSAVALVTVDGGGHTWPGADSYSGGGVTTPTVEATDVLWDFVSRHSLPAGPAPIIDDPGSHR